jgi:hypothetical protein
MSNLGSNICKIKPISFIVLLIILICLYSCASTPEISPQDISVSPITPSVTSIEVEPITPTLVITPTSTTTPTELPLFSAEEITSANPFSLETFPDRYKKVALDPVSSSDQEWQEYHAFILAVREEYFKRENITTGIEGIKNINEELRSLWGMIFWIQHHLDDEGTRKLDIVITPVEYRTMLEEPTKIFSESSGDRSGSYGIENWNFSGLLKYYYDSTNVGPIMGREDIKTGRPTFYGMHGQFAAIGAVSGNEIGTNIALVDMVSSSGYQVLVPILISWEKNFVIPKGSACLTPGIDGYKSVNPLYILDRDMEFVGYKNKENTTRLIIGKYVHFSTYARNIYFPNQQSMVPPICFYPRVNLEMAADGGTSGGYNNNHKWPW